MLCWKHFFTSFKVLLSAADNPNKVLDENSLVTEINSQKITILLFLIQELKMFWSQYRTIHELYNLILTDQVMRIDTMSCNSRHLIRTHRISSWVRMIGQRIPLHIHLKTTREDPTMSNSEKMGKTNCIRETNWMRKGEKANKQKNWPKIFQTPVLGILYILSGNTSNDY